ncbi:MAG TPA: SIS domain-containing protein [Streptosporangiaceae bacterium]
MAFPDAAAYFRAYGYETIRAANSVRLDGIEGAARLLLQAYTRHALVFSCGNGGSAAIANHLQCDHLKGIRTSTTLAPRVVSLSSNVELLTAIANDMSYDEIFTYQLQSQSRAGDVLIAVSSSGRSANIVRALRWAAAHNVKTIALTGFDGGDAREMADVNIHVDAANYGVIEDIHQAVMHALAQYIRQSQMTTEAIEASVF